MRRLLPLALPVVLMTGLPAVLALRGWLAARSGEAGPGALDVAFVVAYVAWLALEGRASWRDASRPRPRDDQHTRELYALAQGATVLSALALGPVHGALDVAGAAALGVVAFYPTSVPVALLVLALLPAVLLRIRLEERALAGLPGYTTFAAARARLVPHVWRGRTVHRPAGGCARQELPQPPFSPSR